ncbi:MarR family transcriptional regulator [bacterium]|nr:MarR family transcriptional regulator [bacterium]
MYSHGANVDLVLVSLRRIIRAIDLHSKKLVQQFGLTVPQLIVLKALRENSPLSVGEVASAVSLSQATVTNILLRLEERGYVHRARSDSDKRRVLVEVSEKGQEILESAPALLHEDFIARFGDLHDWEQNQIISSLQRVASMMQAEKLDAAPFLATDSLDNDSNGSS